MKGLLLFIAAVLTALPCGADSPPEAVTCAEDGGDAAIRLAVHHINQHHHHGYKFQLSRTESSTVDKDGSENGCKRELKLELLETECHIVNPKPYSECSPRSLHARVTANCNITVNIKDDIADVTEYECNTVPMSSRERVMMCPDCPALLPLNHPEGVKSVQAGVALFNKNTTNQSYYRLLEVGRITSGWIPSVGMATYAQFAIVETHCPMGTRISPEACVPLCPDRAHYGVCSSSWMRSRSLPVWGSTRFIDPGRLAEVVDGNELSLRCELYEPKNTTPLEPGQQEPRCESPPHLGHGFIPRGPPAPPVQVQLPEAAAPPAPPGPPASDGASDGAVTSNPAIHPIYPWPRQHLPKGPPPAPETD